MTPTAKDVLFFHKARELAKFGEHRVRVGCAARLHSKLVAGTFNSHRNIPQNVNYTEATFHAETNCVKMIPWEKTPKCTLYICRLSRSDEVMPSRPCAACLSVIRFAEIPTVVYINEYGALIKEKINVRHN